MDFNTATPGDLDSFDCVVVGAGAAGILLAVRLGRAGRRVLLVESGHLEPDKERQQLNEVEQTGKLMGDAIWTRKRIVGGTTTAWGGQSLPFSPLDFMARTWLPNSGWPLSWSDLDRFYDDANAFMGIDDLDYDAAALKRLRLAEPGFDRGVFRYHVSKWAREPNFAKKHGAELRRQATLLYNAHLSKIHLGDDSRVSSIELANFEGDRRLVPVRSLVLASGGIESNRILLLNDHQRRGGLGNHSGWVGKGYMDHPCIEVGRVNGYDEAKLQWLFGTHLASRIGGLKYSLRLSAAEEWQSRHKRLAVSASLMWRYPTLEDPIAAAKEFARRPTLRSLAGLAGTGGSLSRTAYALATKRLIFRPRAEARLVVMAEQAPTNASSIALGDRVDRFGARVARINWDISEATWTAVASFSKAIKTEFCRLGLGQVNLDRRVSEDNPHWTSLLSDANHHMGGTRMSWAPAGGVVNRDLQVWGIPNLWVCSTSVFPTGSHSNPTLTLLALASRLSEQLAGRRSDAA